MLEEAKLHADFEDRRMRRILGIRFFTGNPKQAVDRMLQGGLLVVPAAPALCALSTDAEYREALLSADFVITDSAYMVLVWRLLTRERLRRLSGLEYLRELLKRPEMKEPGSTMWIMAGSVSSKTNRDWLQKNLIEVPESHVYLAPMYGSSEVSDEALIERLHRLRPQHIVLTLGGGTQERVGLYLRKHLDYLPGIHCIGAAIAFLSGDQVHIPGWADRMYLGWLLRILDEPRRYGPRYASAFKLAWMMARWGSELPPMEEKIPPR